MRKPSTRAKWRSSRSAWSCVLEKCLTPPTLLEIAMLRQLTRRICSAMHRAMLLFFCIAMTAIVFGQSPQRAEPKKDGTLVVLVTEGDVYNSAAGNAYVEAYGFVPKYDSKKSFVLKMVKAG